MLLPIDFPGLDLVALGFDPPLGPEDFMVIVTQDCDLVHYSFEEEPFFEVIAARAVQPGAEDPNRRDGKNPRRLQYEFPTPAGSKLFESWMAERRSLPRALLSAGAPLYRSVGYSELQVLKRWLGRRYSRTPLPTEFNRRIAPAQRKLLDRLKAKGLGISGILLSIDSFGELPSTDPYTVSFILVMRPSDYDQKPLREDALSVLELMQRLILQCEGINIEGIEILTEDLLTVSDMRRLVNWDYADYLSVRPGHAPELPAE